MVGLKEAKMIGYCNGMLRARTRILNIYGLVLPQICNSNFYLPMFTGFVNA